MNDNLAVTLSSLTCIVAKWFSWICWQMMGVRFSIPPDLKQSRSSKHIHVKSSWDGLKRWWLQRSTSYDTWAVTLVVTCVCLDCFAWIAWVIAAANIPRKPIGIRELVESGQEWTFFCHDLMLPGTAQLTLPVACRPWTTPFDLR